MEEMLNLKAWMVLHKVSQKDFAETLGYCPQTICNKLNGHRPFSLPEIKKLNSVYGIPADTFL